MVTVGLFFGGRSPEHEVSIVSARNVAHQLKTAGFTVLPIGVDRKGHWHAGDRAFDVLCNDIPSQADGIDAVLHQIDVAFPMIHGVTGEDGGLQGLCELLDKPYVGGDMLNQNLTWDKLATRMLLSSHGLPQPTFRGLIHQNFHQDQLQDIVEHIAFPMFVKPARAGSSIGISKVYDLDQLKAGVQAAFEYDFRVIVEQGLSAREIEIAGLGDMTPEFSVPAEVLPSSDFYDFEEKYLKGATKFEIPASLPATTLAALQDQAAQAWRILNCYGMARVDFLVVGDQPYLNEINTVPGFTDISMYPALWTQSGLSQPELMQRLVTLALDRAKRQPRKSQFTSQRSWFKETP